ALVVFVLCAFFARPASLFARGAGAEFFLLSPDGKLIRKLDATRSDFVDTVRELIYRRSEKGLTIARFSGAKWSLLIPMPVEDQGWNWVEVEWRGTFGLLALLTNKTVVGVERVTGKEVYRRPLGDFALALTPSPRSDRWDVETNRELSHFRYLVNSKKDNSRP